MSRYVLDSWIMEHKGFRFRVDVEHDDGMGPPWKEHDGHGPVSDWRRKDSKRPGERILISDGRDYGRGYGSCRFYDWQEAIKIAKRDGWGPVEEGETAGQRAARAVERDFEYLRRWCNDDWTWCGVVVTHIPDDCDYPDELEPDYGHALWGIESDERDYHREVAGDLADDAVFDLRKQAVDAELDATG